MYTEEERAKWRKGFKRWKETGKSPWKAGKRLSDEEYASIMENVAKDNWQKWGDESEDAALMRVLNSNEYDYRSYYNDNPKSAANADTHWPDEYKTVWHPTFSTQSKYSGEKSLYNPYGYPGGTWQGELFNPQWYQLHLGTGFYKDGYPKLPKFEEGTEPDYQLSSDFISQYEGWSDTAYQKKGDVPTIGYGTTNPKWVRKGRITKNQGIQAMHEDLAANEPLLRKNIKDYDRLPDTAKTVLRDILYNVGQGNMFRKSPKFIDAMNAGNYEEAARQMDWDENKPGFSGAKVRNQARREMFLLDLKKNPVKPRSQLVQLMYDKPEFQPGFQYTPTILTNYSLTNRAGGKLNAWNGAGSPAYGGASVSIPSLYLVMERNLFKPRK